MAAYVILTQKQARSILAALRTATKLIAEQAGEGVDASPAEPSRRRAPSGRKRRGRPVAMPGVPKRGRGRPRVMAPVTPQVSASPELSAD